MPASQWVVYTGFLQVFLQRASKHEQKQVVTQQINSKMVLEQKKPVESRDRNLNSPSFPPETFAKL